LKTRQGALPWGTTLLGAAKTGAGMTIDQAIDFANDES
jgi:hypothetical protein